MNNIMKVIEFKNEYKSLDNLLREITFVKRDKDDILDIPSMNEWLRQVIEFYKKCNVNIDINTFSNFHGSNIAEADKRNKILNKYMEVFFRNQDKLDSDEFTRVLFEFGDIEADSINPIYEEIAVMINNFNNRNQDIFNKLLGEVWYKYEGLGIDRGLFRYEKMSELMKLVDVRTRILTEKIDEEYAKRATHGSVR